MKRFLLPLLAASLTLTACGNNEVDNDTGTDTTTAMPADGSTGGIDAGATSSGADMNNMDGTSGDGNATGAMNSSSPSSNATNAGGADNSGTGISGGQGSNAASGSNAAGTSGAQKGSTRAPYPVDGISTADGAGPTSTRRNRDNVTNDSLNNRAGMGSSR